jgi:hypothetical protein
MGSRVAGKGLPWLTASPFRSSTAAGSPSIAKCSMHLSLQAPRSTPHKFTTRPSELASVADPRERPLVTLTNQKMLLRLIAICDGGEDKVAER